MTDWNRAGRVQGNMDESRLTDEGILQAQRTGRLLRKITFDKVFTSPLIRARHTFDLMAESSANPSLLEQSPCVLDSLTEIQFPWQGSLRAEISSGQWARLYNEFKHRPRTFWFRGFNPVRDLERRAQHLWQTMREFSKGCHLLVAHNQTNKALIATALDLPADLYGWNQGNCCLNVIALEPGKSPILRLCNSYIPISSVNARRSLRRTGTVRFVLHQQGDASRLERELMLNSTTHLYTIGEEVDESIAKICSASDVKHSSIEMVSNLGTDDDRIYACVRNVISQICHMHANEAIAISMRHGRMVSAFVSACFGLGARGLQKFRSDAGGISIIDIKTTECASVTPVRVECFNVPCEETEEHLAQYIIPFDNDTDAIF